MLSKRLHAVRINLRCMPGIWEEASCAIGKRLEFQAWITAVGAVNYFSKVQIKRERYRRPTWKRGGSARQRGACVVQYQSLP